MFITDSIKRSCLLLLLAFLSVLAGCIYNDEPMPQVVRDYTRSQVIRPPVVTPPRAAAPKRITGGVPRDWIPPSRLENKKRWEGIVIHHSAAAYGCAAHEDKSHKSRGWDGLGYHFVINNGVFRNGCGRPDGFVEVSYRWRGQKTGSHCRVKGDWSNYWNEHTIGICLIGNFNKTRPTERQWRSLVRLVRFLQNRYNIPTSRIKGHRDIKPTDCPGKNFSFAEFRRRLAKHY